MSAGIEASDGVKGVSLIIVEDECSWCPLTTVVEKEKEQASMELCTKGEQFRRDKHLDEALEYFIQGAVSNPQSRVCWAGISQVHREKGNFRESEEAARRLSLKE